jgi:hypothetical protein
MIAQIIDSDNYVEIKRIINKLTADDLERQQSQQQAEQENMKQIEQMKIDAMNQQKAFESDLLSLKAENDIKIETNKAMLDMEKIKLQSDLDNLNKEEEDKEVQLKKLENDLKMHSDKMEIEREKLKSQEKIAAMKPAVKSS